MGRKRKIRDKESTPSGEKREERGDRSPHRGDPESGDTERRWERDRRTRARTQREEETEARRRRETQKARTETGTVGQERGGDSERAEDRDAKRDGERDPGRGAEIRR